MMAEHEAFGGISCDHLYERCPALQRSLNSYPRRDGMSVDSWIGKRLVSTVDPLGSDVCGWCRSVYIARRMR